jgi:DNA gyrase inhibitor GyrI
MRRLSLPLAVFAMVMILALPLSAQEETAGIKAAKALNTEIELVEIEPFSYAAVEMMGSYEQHGKAFMKLYTAAGQQGIPARTTAPFGIYWNTPNDAAEEDLKWEIGIPVPDGKEVAAPLVLKKWEHTTVVQRDFEGAIEGDELQAVYFAIFEWIEANGYELAGPMLERFLNMSTPNEKGETIGKVQIVFPVQKKK